MSMSKICYEIVPVSHLDCGLSRVSGPAKCFDELRCVLVSLLEIHFLSL